MKIIGIEYLHPITHFKIGKANSVKNNGKIKTGFLQLQDAKQLQELVLMKIDVP
jgi:hypothetical protein